MRTTTNIQTILIVLIVGLTAFIFLKGKDKSEALTKEERSIEKDSSRKSMPAQKRISTDFDIRDYRIETIANLPDSIADKIKNLRSELKDEGGKDTSVLARITHFWAHQNKPLIAASYQTERAKIKPDTQVWNRAAENYQKAGKNSKDTALKQYATNQAVKAYKKILEKDPNRLDAKTKLAVAYVEGLGQVMKGVGLLKEVLESNPEQKQALFTLGVLSIRSGQLDKALERFQKLVRIQPENGFYHFYLGTVHERSGNTEKAINAFKAYQKKVEQTKLKEQAKTKIEQLETQ